MAKKNNEQIELEQVCTDVEVLRAEHRAKPDLQKLQQGILDVINNSSYWAALESNKDIARPPNFKIKK